MKHLNTDDGPLCGEEGSGEVTYNTKKVDCRECRILLRQQRKQRLRQEAIDAEIIRILKKREKKQTERLARKRANHQAGLG